MNKYSFEVFAAPQEKKRLMVLGVASKSKRMFENRI